MTEASKNLLWFDRVLHECKDSKILNFCNKSILKVDNQATIDFVRSPIENYRSKHIDVKLFFVRDLVYRDVFDLKFVRSKENLSDVFTKPMTRHDLTTFTENVFVK